MNARLLPVIFLAFAAGVHPGIASAAPIVFSGAGANPAGIQATVDNFRSALGVHREINWDGVPDGFATPNNLPADFFNVNSPRGAVFVPNDPGDTFQVSATAASGVGVEFGNIDPSYDDIFQTFSAQRLFTTRGDTTMDVVFRVPGTNALASVNAFGVVFSDVDVNARLRFFDLNDVLMGEFFAAPFNEGLSFLGVLFGAGERVGRVRIIAGNTVMNPGNLDGGGVDIVAMDDFIYGEPLAVPEPALSLLALAGMMWAVRRNTSRRTRG